jgi:ABC-type histidine transport system ATPase subunit
MVGAVISFSGWSQSGNSTFEGSVTFTQEMFDTGNLTVHIREIRHDQGGGGMHW